MTSTSMIDPKFIRIADDMIDKIKIVCPRFSVPSDARNRQILVGSWARALSSTVYPSFVYDMAVDSLFQEASRDDNPPLPGDILRHCRKVVGRLERDPVLGPQLEEWRERRLLERERKFE